MTVDQYTTSIIDEICGNAVIRYHNKQENLRALKKISGQLGKLKHGMRDFHYGNRPEFHDEISEEVSDG